MDAVEYLKNQGRMCREINNCDNCPLGKACDATDSYDCSDYETSYSEEAVAIVEQWAKEHPVKTYKDVLLEKFPKAKLDNNGTPKICKEPLGGSKCRPDYDCKKCWNEEYKEKY